MRCLVTGGLGFIGSHLVRALREQGHAVTVWDNLSNAAVPVPDEWKFRAGHIVFDIRGPLDLFDPNSFDWIFHLAAVSRTSWALDKPGDCLETNVVGTQHLLNVIRRKAGVQPRIVLASSNIVYGSPNPYWASKRAMEDYAEAYRTCYGLNVVVLRYSNTYGPGMRWDDSLCLAAMRRSAVEKGYIELTGDGSQRRHFTHVSDIVRGTIAACESNYQGRPVDLCHPDEISLKQAAEFFDVPLRYIPARTGDSGRLPQNPATSGTFFGWQAQIQFYEGIKDVLAEPKATEVAA